MDAIKKNNQLKVQKNDDKTKGIVYLSERLNRLIKLYPSSFNDREICNKWEKIDYKSLS